MQNEVTYEAAIIEANRAKNPEKRVTDYNRRAKCMDILIEAARFRIKKKPIRDMEISLMFDGRRCPTCNYVVNKYDNVFCGNCGQALDWEGSNNE